MNKGLPGKSRSPGELSTAVNTSQTDIFTTFTQSSQNCTGTVRTIGMNSSSCCVHSLVSGWADGDGAGRVLQLQDVGPCEPVKTVDRQHLQVSSRLFAVVRRRVAVRDRAIPVRRPFGRSSAARRGRSTVGATAQRLVLVARLRRRVFAGLLLLSAVHGVSPVRLRRFRPSLGHHGHGERSFRYFRG